MSKTLIDVDREMLALAQQILGAGTLKDTVNGALRDVVRRWSVVEFAAFARSGLFDSLLRVDHEQPPCW